MPEKIPGLSRLRELIGQSENIVFFGGAGVSTESGIPDFRSQDGLYRQEWDYPPEEIVSHSFFTQKTQEFYRFYRQKMLWLEAEPNAAHRGLARLEREGRAVSATAVRELIKAGRWQEIRPLVPEGTWRYFAREENRERVLRRM